MNALRQPVVFWVVTVLMALTMGSGAVFDLLKTDDVVELFVNELGYPDYFPRLLGAAKLIGVAAVVAAGVTGRFRRLAEWAYAGLAFDVLGALYSHQAAGSAGSNYVLGAAALILVLGSYTMFSIRSPLVQDKAIEYVDI